MASYSFAGNPNSVGWGGSGLSTWGMLGPSIYNNTAAGLKLASSLYDMQNRVALDPYAVPAQAEQYNAQREQANLQAMMDFSTGRYLDELAQRQASMAGNRLVDTAPSPAMTQYGDPQAAQRLITDVASNALAPRVNFLTPPDQRPNSWLFGGF